MATVNITYDTVSKKLDVIMDGEKQDNISSVSIYAYDDEEAHIELAKVICDEENKLCQRTVIYANETVTHTESDVDINKLSDKLSKELNLR